MTMHGTKTIPGLLALSLAAACGTSQPDPIVTEPIRHVEEANALVSGGLEQAAIDYARQVAAGGDFEVLSARTGADGLRHVKLQQVHQGVPVRASEVLVHADESTFLSMNGTVTRNLDGFDTAPVVSAQAAMATARQDHAAGTSLTADAIRVSGEESRLVILPHEDGVGAVLAWHLEFLTAPQPGVAPGRWHYFVDARSGDVVHRFDGLHSAQASGPGGNGNVARSWDGTLDVEEGGDGYLMETERQVTYDMEGAEDPIPDMAVTSATLEFEDPIANDAHGNTEIVLDMMQEWMGFDSIDGNGYQLISLVHWGQAVNNGFWNGTATIYGDGGDFLYPAGGALDFVGHEVNHGFTEFHSGLIYEGMSGGLNESFSDIAGTLAEFFHEGDGADFTIFEDVTMSGGGLRFMCDPPQDEQFWADLGSQAASLDHADDFDRDTGVHYSSGIPNKAFCLSVARLKASSGGSTVDAARRLGQVWYEANASYWTSGSTFTQACAGTVDAARSLGFSSDEVLAVGQSWADVGVVCDGAPMMCNDDGTCDAGAGETCFSCSGDCGACSEECGWFKKAKCKIGIGDCSRCNIDPDCGEDDCEAGCGDGVCAEDETDETCAQDCGCSAAPGPEDQCGGVAPFGCFCDADCETSGDCCADIDVCS